MQIFKYKYDELFNPVLQALHKLGGSGSNSEIEEFKNTITSTEFLAKDIFDKISSKLQKEYSEDYDKLHKIKIILTESNVAWASYEQKINEIK